ncbi:hypothetical protein [uncultured Roseibium sp.]|uniref:hypothetical protein n=1 Tax=uncultured Roseibium sp. TaxID=1936171 RepID=UPI0032170D2F
MSQTKKRRSPHKQIFLGVSEQIAEMEASRGFVDHPFYGAGWAREDQVYERYLIRKDASEYVDQYKISYWPHCRTFFFRITRSRSNPELVNLLNSECHAKDWTDAVRRYPCDIYNLSLGAVWFWGTSPSALKKRDLDDPDAAIAKMMERYRKKSDQLFIALDENHPCRDVHVDWYNAVGSGNPFVAKNGQRIGRL